MSTETNELAIQLLEAFGIDGKRARSWKIQGHCFECITIEVKYLVDPLRVGLDGLAETVTKRFEVVEK